MMLDFLEDMAGYVETATAPAEYNYNLSVPEEVFFQVDGGTICNVSVISATNGFASCEADNGCLDYAIELLLPNDPQDGCYVLEGVTGYYIRGDGWNTDDDTAMEFEQIRSATKDEIEAYGEAV